LYVRAFDARLKRTLRHLLTIHIKNVSISLQKICIQSHKQFLWADTMANSCMERPSGPDQSPDGPITFLYDFHTEIDPPR